MKDPRYPTEYIRGRLSRSWRERDWHGVWFYGSWLVSRCGGAVVFGAALGVLVAMLIVWVVNR